MTKMTPRKPSARQQERMLYILIIIALVIYGFKDSVAAEAMIRVVKEAFTILFQQP